MSSFHEQGTPSGFVPRFRLDVPLHELLKRPTSRSEELFSHPLQKLPEPVFPLHPELLGELTESDLAAHEAVVRTGRRHWATPLILRTMKGWLFPYMKLRVRPGAFQPIIAYLFT